MVSDGRDELKSLLPRTRPMWTQCQSLQWRSIVRVTYTHSRTQLETQVSESIVIPAAQIKTFKDAVTALKVAAAPLAKVDKRLLDDSEVKFLVIRAMRADHLAREVESGKSKRV